MLARRIHRLRALAVRKLAAACRADEIASSVMVMQGGSVFEDIVECVLKVGTSCSSLKFFYCVSHGLCEDPNDADAKYIHFFHERYPLVRLRFSILCVGSIYLERVGNLPSLLRPSFLTNSSRLIHSDSSCFAHEASSAHSGTSIRPPVKDFTHTLKEARALRKARSFHRNGSHPPQSNKGKGDKRKKDNKKKSNGQAPSNGTSDADGGGETSEAETPQAHPSVLPDAPEPIEPRLLFLRATAYLTNAIFLVARTILKLEGIRKRFSGEGGAPSVLHPERTIRRSRDRKPRWAARQY